MFVRRCVAVRRDREGEVVVVGLEMEAFALVELPGCLFGEEDG